MNQPAFETSHATPPAEPSSETVRVGELDPADFSRWDAFVAGCSEATFFHRAGWKTVIERAFGHRTFFLYAEVDGRIVGVLPLAEVKSLLFGHTLAALPFCVYGGIVAEGELARQGP
jgi:CelD/BcsL family acetyltransferase involved in cellulose biosynthesis